MIGMVVETPKVVSHETVHRSTGWSAVEGESVVGVLGGPAVVKCPPHREGPCPHTSPREGDGAAADRPQIQCPRAAQTVNLHAPHDSGCLSNALTACFRAVGTNPAPSAHHAHFS